MQPSPRNRLLEALLGLCKTSDIQTEPVSLPVGHTVYVVGQTMSHVYFPTVGVLSVMVQLDNGKSAEALSVGNEGFIGLPVWLGHKRSIDRVIQQAPGEVRRIPARTFCDLLEGNPEASRLLKHFTTYSLQAAYRAVVCNTHHTVRQRACRRILAMADRAGSGRLQLSHALLALLPRIFDIFVQGEGSLDRAQGGLGAGLAIVKRLIEHPGRPRGGRLSRPRSCAH